MVLSKQIPFYKLRQAGRRVDRVLLLRSTLEFVIRVGIVFINYA